MIASHALKLALLYHTQECDLCLHRKIADFIEKKCPAVSGFEPSRAPLQGACKGAFLVSEKLRGNQRLGNGGAVHADEGSRCTFRLPMQGPGNQFLTCSGFAEDENGRIRWRNFFYLLQHLAHGFARADNFLKHRGAINFLAQSNVLVLEPLFNDFAILDVGPRGIPLFDAPLVVPHGIKAEMKPAILAVSSL